MDAPKLMGTQYYSYKGYYKDKTYYNLALRNLYIIHTITLQTYYPSHLCQGSDKNGMKTNAIDLHL